MGLSLAYMSMGFKSSDFFELNYLSEFTLIQSGSLVYNTKEIGKNIINISCCEGSCLVVKPFPPRLIGIAKF